MVGRTAYFQVSRNPMCNSKVNLQAVIVKDVKDGVIVRIVFNEFVPRSVEQQLTVFPEVVLEEVPTVYVSVLKKCYIPCMVYCVLSKG